MRNLPFSECFIFGHNARYIILEWLVGTRLTDQQLEKYIHVSYETDYAIDIRKNDLYFYTDKLLPGVTLHFPTSAFLSYEDFPPFSKCIVIEEYPWNHQDLHDLLFKLPLLGDNISVLTVLLNRPPRTGSTDLDSPQDLLERICQKLLDGRIPYLIIRDPWELATVQNWSDRYSSGWLRQSHNHLANFLYSIEDLDFSFEELLSPDMQSKICSIDSIRQYGKPYIWDCYALAAERYFFPSGHSGESSGLNQLVELYRSFLDNQPLVQWNIEADCCQFQLLLKREFRDYLLRNRIAHTQLSPGIDLTAYLKLKHTEGPEYQIDHRFWEETIRYFVETTTRDLLTQRLMHHYHRLEVLLT